MLTQQDHHILLPTAAPRLVRAGPVYACPVCGQPALGLVPWPVNPANPCNLDEWAAHIWYLRRRCGCRQGGRVARLGDCITPLEFTYDPSLPYPQRVEANVAAIRVALALIASAMPEGAPACDEPERIVLQLVAGLLPPQTAIEQIRQLAQPGPGGPDGHPA